MFFYYYIVKLYSFVFLQQREFTEYKIDIVENKMRSVVVNGHEV